MPTFAHIASAMQHVLTTVANTAAHTTKFVQRQSKLSGATFSQTLVFGWLANPEATLEHLAQTAATLGVSITPQALDQRFTESAALCLKQVFTTAVQQVLAADPVAIPLLARCAGVYLQDSSTLALPDALIDTWQGCGCGTRTSAALKLQVQLELRTGDLDVQLQQGYAADQAAIFTHEVPRGALRLADLGYWRLAELQRLDQGGVFWLSRMHPHTAVVVAGKRYALATLLAAHAQSSLDLTIQLGTDAVLPCRLLAVRVPQAVADQRRRRLRAEARRKGRALSAGRLALAAWTILVTNVPTTMLSVADAIVLARIRWQIELLFKLWKSHGRIDESRSTKPWRMLCEVYAKLIAMLIQHWLFLIGCWAYPDRSLTKAAQTIQQHAWHLASSWGSRPKLCAALAIMQRCLATRCRMNQRQRLPNAYQLLLNLTEEA